MMMNDFDDERTMEEEEALEADEEDERNELSALEQEQACTFLRVATSKHSRNLWKNYRVQLLKFNTLIYIARWRG